MTEKLLHGADYNYEQWMEYPEIQDQDFELMKQAGCNVMSVGIFSWAKLEPEEGRFHFDWLDILMDRLHENGMKAILATPGGSKPVWVSEKYPEVCRVDLTGKREMHGGRHNHCRSSSVYREKVVEINRRLAERYGNHPALLLWHVNNEYNAGECYCGQCIASFQEWLKQKYGSLEKLNRAWWTTFWSHTYTDWSQIRPVDRSIHALMLDWQRFTSDQTLDFYLAESAPLRQITPDVPVTTNFMLPDVGLDYWKFAEHMSVISWDSYPRWHVEEEDWREGMRTAFNHDIFRSMKDQPFMLMESSPNVTNWQHVSVPKRRNMHILSSIQAVAHGSDSVLYFQWRQSRGGQEKFHGAAVGHTGHSNTRVFRNVARLGGLLSDISEITGAKTKSRVAIIYDFQNEWALNHAQLPLNIEKNYKDRCMAHYQAFWEMGVSVDIKDCSCRDFSSYDLVIAPMLYMTRDGIENRLKEFVDSGGTLVTTYLSGLVDDTDLVHLGGAPGPLKDLLGIWVEDTDTICGHHTLTMRMTGGTGDYSCKDYADEIHCETAEPLAGYIGGPLGGSPALTRNSFGKGRAYYLASRMDESFYRDFYRSILPESLCGKSLPRGVTIQERRNQDYIYRFYMNFTPHPVSLDFRHDDEETLFGGKKDLQVFLDEYGLHISRRRNQLSS